jgi:hypothetical protein
LNEGTLKTGTRCEKIEDQELIIQHCQSITLYVPEVAGLLHLSQNVVVAGEGSFLVAATFASSCTASEGAINGDDLSVRVELLDCHLVLMARSAAVAAQTGSILERMEDLVVADEVLELRLGFASKKLLHPPTAGLAHLKLFATPEMRAEGTSATVHRV